MNQLIFLFEIAGTIAFAISGAAVGLHSKSDLFGVVTLGVITATGGGIIRDVLLGSTPPQAFINPIYVLLAAVVSLIVFLYAYFRGKISSFHPPFHKQTLLIMDSIGLGIFTVVGVSIAFRLGYDENGFLCIFSGVISGIGGGLLRDMMVDRLPDIFRKYIYAVASIAGAMVTWLLMQAGRMIIAEYAGAFLIVVIRLLSAHFRWSLPKVNDDL